METQKERLIKIFMVDGPPYLLQYRRMGRGRKEWIADMPLLHKMIREGTVKEIERTRTTILYKYEEIKKS